MGDSCGFRTDRLLTKKVAVASDYKAGGSMTVTASGITNLHVPLETGAWQVRIYELGEAKSTSTSVGDPMKALKFDDAKNTTFTLKVSFPLPKKIASGKFSANLVAVDQAKADYMCLDIKYSYAAPVAFTALSPAHCTKDSECPSSYCQNGVCHACGDKYCLTDKDCPGSYCANDPTKMPPYTCHGVAKVAEVAPADPICLHEEDTTDHKCFEACASSTFKTKGITMSGRCPAKYSTIDSHVSQLQCPDGVTNVRYCKGHEVNVTITTKGMSGGALALALEQTAAPFTWDSCGFRTDRLLTKKVEVASDYKAGGSMTVTASGVTDLHVPLETGAWQVRTYEMGEAKSTSTAVGDLMKALKFDDAKNTTFTIKVTFPLPKKMASGKFSANLAPFYCHVPPLPTSCKTNADCTSPWYKSWCMNDPSKKAPYVCKEELPPKCKTDDDCKRR